MRGSARLVTDFVSWYARDRRSLLSRVERPPTDGLMLISLSLSTMSSGCFTMPEVVERLHGETGPEGRVPDADRDPLAPGRVGHRPTSRAAARPTPMLTPVPA